MTRKEELKTKKSNLELARLEIKAELAESKRKYVVEGIRGSFERRTTLEADLAEIALEIAQIDRELLQIGKDHQAEGFERFKIAMLRELSARGLYDIVECVEAQIAERETV